MNARAGTLIAAAILAGCASEPAKQAAGPAPAAAVQDFDALQIVRIDTIGPEGVVRARCGVKNDRGSSEILAPGVAEVLRSARPLEVLCFAQGYRIAMRSLQSGGDVLGPAATGAMTGGATRGAALPLLAVPVFGPFMYARAVGGCGPSRWSGECRQALRGRSIPIRNGADLRSGECPPVHASAGHGHASADGNRAGAQPRRPLGGRRSPSPLRCVPGPAARAARCCRRSADADRAWCRHFRKPRRLASWRAWCAHGRRRGQRDCGAHRRQPGPRVDRAVNGRSALEIQTRSQSAIRRRDRFRLTSCRCL